MDRTPVELVRIDAIPPSRAVQYVRVSSERQQHSMEDQLDIVDRYAVVHGMEVVEIYADRNRSGFDKGADE
jgi:DNA invertase Pin-like site-specific DNA recombinase